MRRLTTLVVMAACIALAVPARAQAPAPSQPAAAAQAAPSAATPEQAAPFMGNWVINAEGAPGAFWVTIADTDGRVTAQVSSDMMFSQVTNITMSGATLALQYSFDYEGSPVPVYVGLTPRADGTLTSVFDFANGAYVLNGVATRPPADDQPGQTPAPASSSAPQQP